MNFHLLSKDTLFRNILIMGVVLFINAGCGKQQQAIKTGYFNTELFISAEIELLQKNTQVIKKSALLNGATENQELTETNWESELEIFISANIDKSSYLDQYKVDTITTQTLLGGDYALRYTALDDKLRTQWMQVDFEKASGEPIAIEAEMNTSNFFYQSSQHLIYIKQDEQTTYYKIEGKQDIILLGTDEYTIETTVTLESGP